LECAAWRRERRKGSIDGEAVTIQRQEQIGDRAKHDHVGPTTDGGSAGGI
jgi:hypothetical protein